MAAARRAISVTRLTAGSVAARARLILGRGLPGKEVARRAHQAGEGGVGIPAEKRFGRKGTRGRDPGAVEEETVDSLRADHRYAVDRAGSPAAPGRHENGVHGAVGAFGVIAAQVAGVAEDLVDVRLGRGVLALQLEDDHDAVLQDDDVRPARLARQLVFENRGVGPGRVVGVDELAALPLQPGDRSVPGADLLRAGVVDELFEPESDDAGLRAVEGRQIGLPAVGGFVGRGGVVGHGASPGSGSVAVGGDDNSGRT